MPFHLIFYFIHGCFSLKARLYLAQELDNSKKSIYNEWERKSISYGLPENAKGKIQEGVEGFHKYFASSFNNE